MMAESPRYFKLWYRGKPTGSATPRAGTLVPTEWGRRGCPGLLLSSPLAVFMGGAHPTPQLWPSSMNYPQISGPNCQLCTYRSVGTKSYVLHELHC